MRCTVSVLMDLPSFHTQCLTLMCLILILQIPREQCLPLGQECIEEFSTTATSTTTHRCKCSLLAELHLGGGGGGGGEHSPSLGKISSPLTACTPGWPCGVARVKEASGFRDCV